MMTLQRLHVALTAAALAVIAIGLDLAFTEASIAAKRSKQNRTATPQTQTQTPAQNSTRAPPYHPQGTSRYPWGEGHNLPYPDRPYGDPGRW